MPAVTAKSVLAELPRLGKASYKKVMLAHGAREPLHGVAISELKKIQKRAGGTNHALALELFDSGVYDAMYLAGLLADDPQMSRRDLQRWVSAANCYPLAEYTVPWVAAGGPQGWEIGLEWIESDKERVASAGWCTLSGVIAMRPDAELDLKTVKKLLGRVEKGIHKAPNRVRHAMNSFVIAVGCYVKELSAEAVATGKRMGVVVVVMEGTSCKVPSAVEYIAKVKARGAVGKKRKMVKC